MDSRVYDFLYSVLGQSGAEALKKATDIEPTLEPLLVPRAALAWLSLRSKYEGLVPGSQNSYLTLRKSEAGFEGTVSLEVDQNLEFDSASPEFVAAALAVSLGIPAPGTGRAKDRQLVRLGLSIDALAKTQALTKAMPKQIVATEEESSNKEESTEKAELPGTTAKPQKQVGALGPQAPDTPNTGVAQQKPQALQQPGGGTKPAIKLPKVPKIPSLKIGKSDMERNCPACDGLQFKDGVFKSCICFRELSKNVSVTKYDDGAVLEFKPGADRGLVLALRKALVGDDNG
jgi:hypothetical protein